MLLREGAQRKTALLLTLLLHEARLASISGRIIWHIAAQQLRTDRASATSFLGITQACDRPAGYAQG